MTTFDPAQHLRDGIQAAGWNDTDLWIASVALGSDLGLAELNAITAGHRELTRGQYEILATALNECLAVPGQDRPLPVWPDVPPPLG